MNDEHILTNVRFKPYNEAEFYESQYPLTLERSSCERGLDEDKKTGKRSCSHAVGLHCRCFANGNIKDVFLCPKHLYKQENWPKLYPTAIEHDPIQGPKFADS